MEQFDKAEKVGKQALEVRRKTLDNEELRDWDVLQTMAKMTELYASMGRWVEARNVGERTLEAAQKRQIKGLYRDSEVVVMALQAMKLVYEGLGEEGELLKINLAVGFPPGTFAACGRTFPDISRVDQGPKGWSARAEKTS